jgi:hypothetical protein
MAADPNEMIGPPGTGANQLVAYTDTLAYEVEFANAASATVPAQYVSVVGYLDPSLDGTTVAFGNINYGGRTISVPAGTLNFSTTDVPPVDGCVLAEGTNEPLSVKVSTSFNVTNGRFEMDLTVIDSTTGGVPTDQTAGILPPTGTSCSGGYFTYTAKPLATATPGSVINASATIVFDTNAALTTNTWWNILN